MSSARAPLGAQDRLGEAGPREAPVGNDPQAAQPQQVGAPVGFGVDLLAKAPERRGAAARRRASRAVEDIAAARTAPSIVCETPSISFSAMLPVKPSVTITSATPLDDVAALDVADELEGAGPASSRARAARREPPARALLPRVGLLAVRQQPDAGTLDSEHDPRQRGAHEGELHEVLAPGLGVGADVQQRHRPAREPAAGSPAPGGRCRARA